MRNQSGPDAPSRPQAYPFSAVVGQDDYKLALLANAVDPLIGGVLAVGERGTAKSTLARSFADLLWTDAEEGSDRVPFVELPLGATVDRLTGALDTAKLLAGDGVELQPGLLADANGGLLYADEVNLLGDHLVDVMLDAAAFGVVRVERDGISAEQPARFLLVGTMNPEEGALRPQLLDRFGLSVSIVAPLDRVERAEIVSRRIAFEKHPEPFVERFAGTQDALRDIVAGAREVLLDVDLPSRHLETITDVCMRLGVEGMRADIVIARTATALAALDVRGEVIERDIETAARLALPHRARQSAVEDARFSVDQINSALAASMSGEQQEGSPQQRSAAPRARTEAGRRKSEDAEIPPLRAQVEPRRTAGPIGRSQKATGGELPSVDSAPSTAATDLDVIATARAAVTRRLVGGSGETITAADLRDHVRSGREANLVLCVVDASSSVLENGRGGELRALLGGLVADARRKRDRVGLIVFRGREARLVAPPSRNHAAVLTGLDTIEPGGTTPLAEGIRVAHDTAQRELRRNPDLRPIVALVTDGYANIARSGDAVGEARRAATELKRAGITLVVIGESSSGAPEFARTTGAEFYPFDPSAGTRNAA
jgi:magnesium chelatase subunit D